MLFVYFSLALGVSFVCSLLESVLLSTTASHTQLLGNDGDKSGKRWQVLKQNDAVEPLTAILSLNTIAHTVGAVGVGVEVEVAFPGQYTVAIASALMTVAILLLSEILPKTLGAAYWKQLGPVTAITLVWLVKAARPIVVLILVLKKFLPSPDTPAVTRGELAAMADISESEGSIKEDEETVITNVLNLQNMQVGEIMTPRVVIYGWSIACTVRQALEDNPDTTFSRIPLYGDSIDDLRGFVLRTDVLMAATKEQWDRPLLDFAKTLTVVAVDQPIDQVLKNIMQSQTHLALVQDEFGGTAGVVSLEDVIETLLGEEIVDEGDEVADMRELARQKVDERADEAADEGGSISLHQNEQQ